MTETGIRRSARLKAVAPVPPPAARNSAALKKKATAGAASGRPAKRAALSSKPPPVKPKAAAATAAVGHASRAREEASWAEGVELVIGCDEAGRGPLAGPVVAAACALPASAAPIAGVGDSKTIPDEGARERLYEQIVSTPGVRWSARVVSAARIDDINILMASLEAMRQSIVDVLGDEPPARALALVDGPFSPWKEGEKYVAFQSPRPPSRVALDVEPIKGGDAKVYAIAAASIIAKVTRDRLMHEYDAVWPEYGLGQHKGYPTSQHVAAIAKHGAVPGLHRRTFAPLKARGLPPPSRDDLARVDAIAHE